MQYRSWESKVLPKRILVIRLQALGDVVITLPYIQGLRRQYPDVEIDFLTRQESASIPECLILFNKIHSLNGGRNVKMQLIYSLFFILSAKKYDVVIDLQNNIISRTIRKGLLPKAWSSFDRFSSISAGERTANTIKNIGLGDPIFHPHFILKNDSSALKLLKQNGWDENSNLVILNPAGFFTSRNWPLKNYLEFARLWLKRDEEAQFLILGIDRVKNSAIFLKQELAHQLIDLTGKTTPAEAFAIIQKARFALSEDSGLMHMAWVSGVPTIALFGSSRSDWSAPLGNHTVCLNSSDMECGECMEAECEFGDVRCLTRFTPQMVLERAVQLLKDNA